MSKPPHIMFLVTTDLTYDQRMQRIAAALSAAGFNVSLVGRLKSDSHELFENAAYAQIRLTTSKERGPVFYYEFNQLLYREGIRLNPDCVCACDVDTLLAGYRIQRKLGCKFAFDAHEWFTEVPELKGRPLTKTVWSQLKKFSLPATSLRYTVSQAYADVFKEKFGVAFEVIRNVPNQRQLVSSMTLEERPKVLWYQGALNMDRGLEISIEAMQALEDYTLNIAGQGPLMDALVDQINGLKLTDRVHLLGYQLPLKLNEYNVMARYGLNLLTGSSKSYAYSLANKFFDYQQAHLPSINTDYVSYRNIMRQYPCGLLIDQPNTDSLVAAIRASDAEPKTYNSMVRASVEAAKVFTWEKESEHLVQLYTNLLLT